MRVVAGVAALFARHEPIERRLGEEQVPGAHDLGHLLEEERHQQRRDMRAVHIGVGHDDDTVVAQRARVAVLARPAAQCQRQVGNFAVGADLVGGRARNVQDLAADRQDRLRFAVARLLGAAARAIAFDDEQFSLALAFAAAIGELARQAQLLGVGGALALDFALLLALQALVHALHHFAEQRLAALHIVGEEVVEVIAHRVFDQPRGFGRGQAVLGLRLELRFADEHAEHHLGAGHHIVGGEILGLLGADQFAERAKPAGQRGAQALFVRPAIRRGDGVAIPACRPV